MKILKFFGILILVLLAVVLVLGLIAPKEYTVERSVVIEAEPAYVWGFVSSLEASQEWSPWAELDTNQVVTFEGEPGSVGSKMTWKGNDKVGEGSQVITEVEDGKEVETELTFVMPFGESVSNATVEVEEVDGGTEVSWEFEGDMPYPMNAMLILTDMDAALGKDFERGLGYLKDLVDANLKEEPTDASIMLNELPAQAYIVKKDTVAFSDIGKYFSENLPALYGAISQQGFADKLNGVPSGIYYLWDTTNQQTYMAVAAPISDASVMVDGYETITIEAGNALQHDYYGNYDDMEPAHTAISSHMMQGGYAYRGPVMESYITDPAEEPDTSKWLTKITYFVE